MKVKCDNMERGCGWIGTIGTLDNHIATCQFALVPCPNKCEDEKGAGELHLMRKDLDDHLKTKCPKRAYECQHCGEKGTYASITEDHDKVCNKKIVLCPNNGSGCPLSMERGKTKQHVRSVCDYTEVVCAYESLGCAVRMLRKDVEKHEKEKRETHVDLALDTVSSREEQHKTPSEGEAVIFKLSGYASKKEKNEEFYSRPFYSSPGGYKMCINIDANGHGAGKGTDVSIFTKLLKGRYDDQLHWPFLGTVTYELLNQLTDDNHFSRVLAYDASCNLYAGRCYGFIQFLPHSSLSHDPATNTQYLLDDTLYFRVSVTVNSKKPWLVCTDKEDILLARNATKFIPINDNESIIFRVTYYNTKKTANTHYYSDPFYTTPKGYRMQLLLYANGYGTSEGTHVSVYITLLQGANDEGLAWPYVGSVTLTLLNQLANDNHYSHTCVCEPKDNVQFDSFKGLPQFISHCELSHNPLKNTQYLVYDTLYFRVTVEALDRKPWLVCKQYI